MAKPTPKTVLAASVATLAGIGIIAASTASKLKPAELIDGIIAYQNAKDKAYAAVGKLRYFLEQSIAASGAKTTITEVLRTKAGLTAGTISNTAYGAKTFALVESKDLTEEEYDSLRFAECYGIVRAMSPDSKRKLSGAEVATLVRDSRATLEDELQSLVKTGMTLAEATAEAEKVQAAQKAKADKEAADKAKADREAAEAADKLKKDATQTPADNGAPTGQVVVNGEVVAETPIDPDDDKMGENVGPAVTAGIEPGDGETDASEDPAPSEAEAQPSEQPAPEPTPTVKASAPVATQEPPAPPVNIPTLAQANELMDALEQLVAQLTVAEQAVFLNQRLMPFGHLMMGALAESEEADAAAQAAA